MSHAALLTADRQTLNGTQNIFDSVAAHFYSKRQTMLRIAPFKPDVDYVVPIEIDGEINSRDFSNVLAKMEEQLAKHDKLRLYVEIKSLGGMSASTAFNELKDAIKHWERFDKLAVVSDVEGIRTATTVIDKLSPNTECETFRSADRDSAQAWVA